LETAPPREPRVLDFDAELVRPALREAVLETLTSSLEERQIVRIGADLERALTGPSRRGGRGRPRWRLRACRRAGEQRRGEQRRGEPCGGEQRRRERRRRTR